jgi:hypothetical protein
VIPPQLIGWMDMKKTVVFAKLCSYTEAHTQGIILGQKKKACQK